MGRLKISISHEASIAAVVFIGIAILALFGRGAVNLLKRAVPELVNISQEQAMSIARERIGRSVVAAIPFRDKDSSQQFIVVLGPSPKADLEQVGMPLYILEGSSSVYQIHGAKIAVFDIIGHGDGQDYEQAKQQYAKKNLFGVVDVRGDGNKEVFAIHRSGGSGAYTLEVTLYQPMDKSAFTLSGSAAYGGTQLANIEISENASKDEVIKAWLFKKANEFVASRPQEKGGYYWEIEQWRQANGVDFEDGNVQLQFISGPAPVSGGSVACSVQDGNWTWVSYFKGAIFGYDKSRDTHFVVYAPEVDSNWAYEMHADSRYLWFIGNEGSAQEPEIFVAFDKSTHQLSKVRLTTDDQKTKFAGTVGCEEQP